MCTLAIYFQMTDDYPVVIAANRDEYLERPAAKPTMLCERPHVVGGKDLRAGGRQSNAQYQYTLQSESVQELYAWTPKLVDALEHNSVLTDVSSDQQQRGLETYQGTVLAVTHDRWFARSFERFLLFMPDGSVRETTEPIWD